MAMQIPENWEFIRWHTAKQALVWIPPTDDRVVNNLTLIQPHQNPFYDVIFAAHGPIHEPTIEQMNRENQLYYSQKKYRNKIALIRSLAAISNAVDNPSHWNRLNPELKANVLGHHRKVLLLRVHQVMDGSEVITPYIPTLPEYDILDAENSTPHRETNLLIPENTTLFRGDILVYKTD